VLENNPDSVKIVFKNLPLTNIHNMAELAALAGLAAHNQGKFWQMHDALFAMNNNISMEKILAAAKEIGLDVETFSNDLRSDATRQRLMRDIANAREAEVSGTPTIFVNGRHVTDRGPDALQLLINEELAKAGKDREAAN
jgi:predicted DsbA family dithiol-disulfide isomerase